MTGGAGALAVDFSSTLTDTAVKKTKNKTKLNDDGTSKATDYKISVRDESRNYACHHFNVAVR